MNKNQKGFTLVEILGIIAVLIAILWIAVPRILAVIDKAKMEAFRDTAYLIVHTGELFESDNPGYHEFYFDENGQQNADGYELEFHGQNPTAGIVLLEDNGNTAAALHNGTWCAIKNADSKLITITTDSPADCVAYGIIQTDDPWSDIAIDEDVPLDYLIDLNEESDPDSETDGRDIKIPINPMGTIPGEEELNLTKTYYSMGYVVTSVSFPYQYQYTIDLGNLPLDLADITTANVTTKGVFEDLVDFKRYIVKRNMGEVVFPGGDPTEIDLDMASTFRDHAAQSDNMTVDDVTVTCDETGCEADIIVTVNNITGVTPNFINGNNVVYTPLKFTVEFNEPAGGEFVDAFGGSNNDYFNMVRPTTTGFIGVGQTPSNDYDLAGLAKGQKDGFIVKYDSDGNKAWVKTFGGTLDDNFYDVVEVSGGYVAIGTARSTDGDMTGLHYGTTGTDAIIVKYDTNGNVLWKKHFGGTLNDTFSDIVAISGGVVIDGWSTSTDNDMSGINNGGQDAIVVKYNDDGDVVWEDSFGGSSTDTFIQIRTVSDGYVICGSSSSTTGDLAGLNKGGQDAIVVKYNSDGSLAWNKNYGGTGTESFYSLVDAGNGYVIVGYSNSTNGDLSGINKGLKDGIIVKYGLTGSISWNKNFGGGDYEGFETISKTGDGYYVVGGYSGSNDGDMLGLDKGYGYGYNDGVVVKYNDSGTMSWTRVFGGTGDEDFYGSAVTDSGTYVVVGFSGSDDVDMAGLSHGDYDAVMLEYNSSGTIVRQDIIGGTYYEEFDYVQAFNGGVIAYGYVCSDDGDFASIIHGPDDGFLVKYLND